MPFFYFDTSGIWFVIVAALLAMFAQMFVTSSYSKYSKIDTIEGRTGAEVARMILNLKGITDVEIVESRGGVLSDHYDPTKKVVALSPKVYNDSSIASVSVAAHEVGHAIQHSESYAFIGIRNKLLPMTIISSKFGMLSIFIGLAFSSPQKGTSIFFTVGIAMLAIIALFQFVTLPVEFDASRRALKILSSESILDSSEMEGSKKMLTAAALTYVAALLSTVLNILRLIAVNNNRNNRR
ncbi:MAG: zinc metallopeptidase [Erysipelothrix sp.]